MILLYCYICTVFVPLILARNKTAQCVPNTQFIDDDRICNCDAHGTWNNESCSKSNSTAFCRPGETIWRNCNQCYCQDDRRLLCTDIKCVDDISIVSYTDLNKKLAPLGPWCMPYRSYHVECTICVCPASGRTYESRCALDNGCSVKLPPLISTLPIEIRKTVCLPHVMYLFPCFHCLCSDKGLFEQDTCVGTCKQPAKDVIITQRCMPRTFYRQECNICFCPDGSYGDGNYCTGAVCSKDYKPSSFQYLRSLDTPCEPHVFTRPRCFYCECSDGKINENSCLKLDCLKSVNYGNFKEKCSTGEMVPICMECFCLSNSFISEEYCSKSCSNKSKLDILEKLLNDDSKTKPILDNFFLREGINANNACVPSTIFLNHGRYCICSKNGTVDINLCTLDIDVKLSRLNQIKKEIDLNASCEPNTFVEFDCNTCFCSKTGKIDLKWCTYDNCEDKKIIQESHKLARLPADDPTSMCTAGSLYKVDCNYCICPISGLKIDLACTGNHCSGVDKISSEKFICEPFTYYEVDCNICYCPQDGFKNVAKCSKNVCEKNALRSHMCVPGQLFSDECNVCVCPPNGDKTNKLCTNHTCPESAKHIFMLTQTVPGNEVDEDTKRSLDVCFHGEEFIVACNLCICPEIGLRAYAACTPISCTEDDLRNNRESNLIPESYSLQESRRTAKSAPSMCGDSCVQYGVRNVTGRLHCEPGSMYISRCKECVCPEKNNMNNYCRQFLTDNYPCNRSSPNFEFQRIDVEENSTTVPFRDGRVRNVTLTRFTCTPPGSVMDSCFVCTCADDVLIEEHCFKSDAVYCARRTPSFLKEENKII